MTGARKKSIYSSLFVISGDSIKQAIISWYNGSGRKSRAGEVQVSLKKAQKSQNETDIRVDRYASLSPPLPL